MQQSLFHDMPAEVVPLSSRIVLACQHNESEVLRSILHLHNNHQPIEADVTFSTGAMWTNAGIPWPKYRFDLRSQAPGTVIADVTALPVASESFSSVMFDPPFIAATGAQNSAVITERFTQFRTIEELRSMYRAAMCEIYRVLKVQGLLVFKNQDIKKQQQYFNHIWIAIQAVQLGFSLKDLFVICRKAVILRDQPQYVARKNLSYYWVLRKQPGKDFEI